MVICVPVVSGCLFFMDYFHVLDLPVEMNGRTGASNLQGSGQLVSQLCSSRTQQKRIPVVDIKDKEARST